jgi:ribosomal protein S18 acetylase RimI-like enzyme
MAEFNARGSGVAWLGVWEHNPRAITFYGKLGFVACGEQVFPLGNDPQRDIVMARPL